MKTIILFICFTLFIFNASASKNPNANQSTSKKILIVGFEKDKIVSNYYYDEVIAEKTNLPVDSLEQYFSRMVINPLTKSAKKNNLQFIPFEQPEKVEALNGKIQYEGEDENLRSNLSTLDNKDFEQLLDNYDAEYLIVISQYYMKKELQPFPYLFHIVNYEIYDRNKDKKYEGRSYFNTNDLIPLTQLDKQYQKLAGKMMTQINKVAK